jgi:hypothetical protein
MVLLLYLSWLNRVDFIVYDGCVNVLYCLGGLEGFKLKLEVEG